ncbi:hypothetical protein YT1_p10026 (plasmid) [Rhodococcus ruber]|nr:hypothetical protein YT1_p10026 [Rhodococcus ruber]
MDGATRRRPRRARQLPVLGHAPRAYRPRTAARLDGDRIDCEVGGNAQVEQPHAVD